MTDPETADRTYIEPITWQVVEKIIAKETPDALLPTLGGQTGLNTAMDLYRHGVLEKYGVEMIGANADVIDKAEDRRSSRTRCSRSASTCPRAASAALAEAREASRRSACRASSGPASRWAAPAAASPTTARSSTTSSPAASTSARPRGAHRGVGHRLEGVRAGGDARPADNVVIICSIENLDPMGVHTGDSITVAPAQTLTDKEYQRMRDAGHRESSARSASRPAARTSSSPSTRPTGG